MPTISQLFVYPVKSLRGYTLESAQLSPQGLIYDRQWMIINDDNIFVTQRKYSEMILIHTRIESGQLILSKPNDTTLEPLVIEINRTPVTPAFEAKVWKDMCWVLDEGEQASQWLSRALNISQRLRLVRMSDIQRPQSKPDLLGKETHTYFADAAPFLVTNEASLVALNTHLNTQGIESVTMERFRPNIVVQGLDAFAEHDIKGLANDQYALNHCYPCQRCVVPTIDIETGQRHGQRQPFSMLAEINGMPENAKVPAFGENATLVSGDGGFIHVGDTVNIR